MQLELNNNEVYIVINALDFYSRIWIGQYSEIEKLLVFYESNCTANFSSEEYRKCLLELRSIIIPELAYENMYCSLGIWNTNTNCMAKSAYDMQQIVRYTQAWYLQPKGGIGVNFDTPILKGDLPIIKCECRGRKAETVLIIKGMESNFNLIERSLNVFMCLLEHKLGELFQYYTDDKKALALVKEIENTYMRQGRKRKKNVYLCEIERLKKKVEKLCTFSEKKVQ